MKWCRQNPDATSYSGRGVSNFAVPAWVAADAGGAIGGGVIGAIDSYYQNGEVDWTSVGIGALGGAIDGSVGISGKIARWVRSIF